MKIFYQGFSTRTYADSGTEFIRLNIDVINEDLLNHIFTIKGERVHMPDWGTRIPLLQFELNDPYTQQVITEDLTAVFSADPRVELVALDIITAKDSYALIASCKVNYLEFQVTQDLNIEITSQ
jgi:phage baseplate assembly protein W